MNFPDTPEFKRAPSVADELAFAELPHETQAVISRLFGGGGLVLSPPDAIEEAYRAGWEDAIANATVESYGPSPLQVSQYVTSITKGIGIPT